MRIRSLVQPGAFEPEAIAAMSEAFEAACNELHCAGHAAVMGEVIAGRIVAAARFGERARFAYARRRLSGRSVRKPNAAFVV
jgi:hypothetical protein